MGNRYVKSVEKKKIFYADAKNHYVHSMSETIPYDEIKFDNEVKLEDQMKTPDDSDLVYFVEADLKYPCNVK